jgi:hypothetical protein
MNFTGVAKHLTQKFIITLDPGHRPGLQNYIF